MPSAGLCRVAGLGSGFAQFMAGGDRLGLGIIRLADRCFFLQIFSGEGGDGIDISVIALWLGHESSETSMIYLVSQKLHQTGEGTAGLRQLAA
jgi:hypothetical protein